MDIKYNYLTYLEVITWFSLVVNKDYNKSQKRITLLKKHGKLANKKIKSLIHE